MNIKYSLNGEDLQAHDIVGKEGKVKIKVHTEDKQFSDEYEITVKEEYGTENKFKTTYEDESVKEEVNGSTGDIRITHKDFNENNVHITEKSKFLFSMFRNDLWILKKDIDKAEKRII